jgi:hypothetical protein
MAPEPLQRPDAWSARHDRRVDTDDDSRWYAVRSLFSTAGDAENSYEERITLWRAGSSDEALEKAAAEAEEYAEFAGASYLSDFGQAYELADAPPRNGAEVFSLTRASALPPRPYLERFFDTGDERP